jgi:hypothetical protein
MKKMLNEYARICFGHTHILLTGDNIWPYRKYQHWSTHIRDMQWSIFKLGNRKIDINLQVWLPKFPNSKSKTSQDYNYINYMRNLNRHVTLSLPTNLGKGLLAENESSSYWMQNIGIKVAHFTYTLHLAISTCTRPLQTNMWNMKLTVACLANAIG